MSKEALRQRIIDALARDHDILARAAQTAYETATHEENVAENKYDTLGLEASYLATGQARRMLEIEQALKRYREEPLRPYEEAHGIRVGCCVELESELGTSRRVLLGPDAAGLVLDFEGKALTVITPHSPLGQALKGHHVGDEVQIVVAGSTQLYEIIEAR